MNLQDYLTLLPKEADSEGWTTGELAEQWGISQPRVRDLVKQGIAAGIMEFGGVKPVVDMAGRTNSRPCYRQVQKKAAKKK